MFGYVLCTWTSYQFIRIVSLFFFTFLWIAKSTKNLFNCTVKAVVWNVLLCASCKLIECFAYKLVNENSIPQKKKKKTYIGKQISRKAFQPAMKRQHCDTMHTHTHALCVPNKHSNKLAHKSKHIALKSRTYNTKFHVHANANLIKTFFFSIVVVFVE